MNVLTGWQYPLRLVALLLVTTGLMACGGTSVEVKVTVEGDGRITAAEGIDCGTRCSTKVPVRGSNIAETQMTLTAHPGPGSRLLGWNVEECGQSNTCTFTVQQYCAIGVSPLPGCWAWDTNSYHIRPVFVRESEVAGTGWSPFSACAIYNSGNLRCWHMSGEDDLVPEVVGPRQVVTEAAIRCVDADNGVACWGQHTRPQYNCDRSEPDCEAVPPVRPPLPDLYPPLTLAAGEGFACALDVEGVKCWTGYGDLQAPELFNPANIRTEDRRVCADDGDETVCWNRTRIWRQ